MNKIKVLVVDDHKVFRRSLVGYLKTIQAIKVIGWCDDGWGVLSFLSRDNVDVILMDIKMKKMGCIDIALLVSKFYPKVKILGMSFYDDWGTIYKFLNAGGHGFVSKFELDGPVLIQKIRAIYDQKNVVQSDFRRK